MRLKPFVILGKLGLVWQKPSAANLIYSNVFLIILQFSLILGLGHLLPPLIPFYYSQPWGPSQLASPHHLFLLPGLSLFVLVANGFIVAAVSENILIRLLLWTSNVFAFINILALIRLFFHFLI